MSISPESQDANGGDGDDLVGVAQVNDRVEAEMLRGLLEDGGIPSMVKSVGVDGPALGIGWLNPAGGPQVVMVHAKRVEEARAVLSETLTEDDGAEWYETANARHLEDAAGGRKPRGYGLLGAYARIYLWSFGVFAAVFGLFMLSRAV